MSKYRTNRKQNDEDESPWKIIPLPPSLKIPPPQPHGLGFLWQLFTCNGRHVNEGEDLLRKSVYVVEGVTIRSLTDEEIEIGRQNRPLSDYDLQQVYAELLYRFEHGDKAADAFVDSLVN